MNLEEIKALVKNSGNYNESLSLSDLEKLKSIANVTLEIDRDTNDYYYKVILNELVGKEFSKELITKHKWELSINEEEINLVI